jgi:hypothetical protein
MSTPIDYDAIIKSQNRGIRSFMAHQKWRIRELRRINKHGATDEEKKEIVIKLQSAGILDENGKLAYPYNGREPENDL